MKYTNFNEMFILMFTQFKSKTYYSGKKMIQQNFNLLLESEICVHPNRNCENNFKEEY